MKFTFKIQIFQTMSIRHTLRAELTWSHYRLLMRVEEAGRRPSTIRKVL